MTKSTLRPWLIWSLGALFFLAEYFARVSPSVMVQELMHAFSATGLALGTLSASFYFAYIPMQLPVGILVDRYGPHRLLTVMAILCGVSCLIFGLANNLLMAELGRFLMGLSASFAFVGTLKLATMWFPAKRFGLLAGLTQALGMLGAVIGEAPTSIAVGHIGWRQTMILMSGLIVLLGIMIGLIVRDRHTNSSNNTRINGSEKSVLSGLMIIIRNPQTWLNGCYIGLLYAPSAAFAELWGVNFLQQSYHLTATQAGGIIGMIFIGWTFGGPITGWLSDKITRRKPLQIASSICGIIFMGSVILIPNLSITQVIILLFLYGFTNTGVAISYAVASEINGTKVNGTSMAFANMASVLIGAILQPIIGLVLDHLWDGTMINTTRAFTSHDYRLALVVLPICSLLSLGFAMLIKETYCQRVD